MSLTLFAGVPNDENSSPGLDEPAHEGCLQALELTPVADLGIKTGQGAGALAVLPQLNLAAELVGEVVTGGSSIRD